MVCSLVGEKHHKINYRPWCQDTDMYNLSTHHIAVSQLLVSLSISLVLIKQPVCHCRISIPWSCNIFQFHLQAALSCFPGCTHFVMTSNIPLPHWWSSKLFFLSVHFHDVNVPITCCSECVLLHCSVHDAPVFISQSRKVFVTHTLTAKFKKKIILHKNFPTFGHSYSLPYGTCLVYYIWRALRFDFLLLSFFLFHCFRV
jgi:hypothetical protein